MRLIDADALIAEWYKLNNIGPEDCGARFVGYQEIARLINNAPTVQPTGDLISRADAIEVLQQFAEDEKPNDEMSKQFQQYQCGRHLAFLQAVDEIKALPSADAKPKKTEEVREALMRLAMCAREECDICKHKDKCGFEFQYNISTENMNTILEALSADAVHGAWIPIEETLPTYDGGEKTWLTGMKCSNCGKLFDLRVGYYFCPSCGARMKGGDDNANTD